MELKRSVGILGYQWNLVLIVPFMELKQRDNPWHASRYYVLIVPFMELKPK